MQSAVWSTIAHDGYLIPFRGALLLESEAIVSINWQYWCEWLWVVAAGGGGGWWQVVVTVENIIVPNMRIHTQIPPNKTPQGSDLFIIRAKRNKPPWLQTSRLLQGGNPITKPPEITPPRYGKSQTSPDLPRQRQMLHHRLWLWVYDMWL